MAEALVTDLIEQLVSITALEAQQEIRSVVGVDEEIRKLERNLHTLKAVLNDADGRQIAEEAVKFWLERLNNVCFEMEDVLDEWNTAMIKSKIPKEENADNAPVGQKKVCSFISSPLCCFRLVDKHVLRQNIAYKIKELNGKLDEMNKEKERYGFQLNRVLALEEVVRPTTFSFVYESEYEIDGRDKVKDDLVSILFSEEERSPYVISLVGMGGIGKTTLAQLAYNHSNVQAHFDVKGWVCVSDPFDQCRVAKGIIEALGGGSPYVTEFESLLQQIHEIILGKKFFLVLDDVWTENYRLWEPFKLALKNGVKGNRILVTTRKNRVANMMESASIINLGLLSEEDCWLLFSRIAFFNRDPEQCKQLEDLARQLVKRCKGLPLAAKTLGSLMRFKRSREQWMLVLNSNLWEFEDMERGVFVPLLLSYYELSSPLKRCFLYCAIFPKDYTFSDDELVFMWMAQGYIKSKENMEMEIVAREYFKDLVIRSFFQDFGEYENDGKVIMRCKMHDIVHDFAQLMTKNECFTRNSDRELYKNARHLHLEIPIEAQFHESIYSAKYLRTLIFVYRSDYNLSNLFHHFRCLRTLTLYCQDATFKELPVAVENFIHLRYLKLVNYHGDGLPETICNLCNLQSLVIIIRSDRFKKLPHGMGKLINLRHLIWDDTYLRCSNFPRGIERLTSLRTVNHISISAKNDSKGCILGELQNLNHLQGALKIKGLGHLDACEVENAQLKKKTGLHSLKLWFNRWDCKDIGRESDASVLNALESPPGLEYLRIEEYRATTMPSNWMMSLTRLKVLFLECFTELECLPPLGKLPFLESLRILEANSLKKVGVEFLGIESKKKKDNIIVFPNLKSLTFERMWVWEEWIGIGGEEEEEESFITIMPCLQELKIRHCPKLKSLPDFLRKIPLKNLDIYFSQILRERCERGTGEDWPKIFDIPNIRLIGVTLKETVKKLT